MNSPRRGEVPDLARERLGVAVEQEAGDLYAHLGEDDDEGQDGHASNGGRVWGDFVSR